jgi:hypothetical protein
MRSAAGQDYPRIANLWGGSPLSTDYEQWARYDLLVMAGGPTDAWRRFSQEVRARNPNVLLLDTAPLMNLGPPEQTPWMRDEWYLRRPDGEKIHWWAGQVYVPNLFIDECLAALLQQTEERCGELLREGTVDGVFYDSVVGAATWLGEVDTNRDGIADAPTEVNARWQERQNLFFDRLRERWPKMRILANDVDRGHAGHVNGRLFEGGPLLDRVANGGIGPEEVTAMLDTWMKDAVAPGLTFALMTHPIGWQGWRVGQGDKVTTRGELDRARRDFWRMRLGLATTLMTDAYYAYDLGTVWYGLPWWYAEYEAPLGKALGPAEEVFEVPPVTVWEWSAGQPTEGLVVDAAGRVTPEGIEGEVTDPHASWHRLFATDPAQVPLEPGKSYRIEADCEVLRQPTGTFQFNVRTGRGGWEHHDKGVAQNVGPTGSEWPIRTTIVPDDFDDYAVEWHLLGAGALRLKRLKITRVGESYWRREFAGGMALLNGTPQGFSVRLPRPLRRLRDEAAPRHVIEVDDADPGFSCEGAWQDRNGEGYYYGRGYRAAAKPGEMARWSFTALSEDTYTLFACVPSQAGPTRARRAEMTDSAMYSVVRPADGPAVTVDQRGGDGGWVWLLEVRLRAGEECQVTLCSGGAGLAAADAIRAESAARFNDGAVIEEVFLEPLDGVVLLNK